jgi:putative transposase
MASYNYNFNIYEMEVDKNHIHLLVEYSPILSVTKIISLLKQISTYRIWRLSDKITNFLSKHFWKEKTFWFDGYFICSIGSASIDAIKKYIEGSRLI